MSDIAHVHGWPRPRSPFALAAGAVLVGSVLFSAVLLLVGAVPAWGGVASAQSRRADAADQPGGGSRRRPRCATAPWSSGRRRRHRASADAVEEPDGQDRTIPGPTTPRPTPRPTQATADAGADPVPSAHRILDPRTAPTPAPDRRPPSPRRHRGPAPARPAVATAADRADQARSVGSPRTGSRMSVVDRASPARPAQRHPAIDVAAGRASFLPGKEMGVKIFAAGLVALVVSIGGLVTLAVRRRQ